MSLIIGVATEEDVILAADGRSFRDGKLISDSRQKLFKLSDDIALGIAGDSRQREPLLNSITADLVAQGAAAVVYQLSRMCIKLAAEYPSQMGIAVVVAGEGKLFYFCSTEHEVFEERRALKVGEVLEGEAPERGFRLILTSPLNSEQKIAEDIQPWLLRVLQRVGPTLHDVEAIITQAMQRASKLTGEVSKGCLTARASQGFRLRGYDWPGAFASQEVEVPPSGIVSLTDSQGKVIFNADSQFMGITEGIEIIDCGTIGTTSSGTNQRGDGVPGPWIPPGWSGVSKTVPSGKKWVAEVAAIEALQQGPDPNRDEWAGFFLAVRGYWQTDQGPYSGVLPAGSYTGVTFCVTCVMRLYAATGANDAWATSTAYWEIREVPA